MNITFDARSLITYPVGKPGFSGGTELQLHRVAKGLAEKGHVVNVVTPDLQGWEWRGGRLWYWPPDGFPRTTDVLIAMHNVAYIHDFMAPIVVLASNGPDPWLGPEKKWIPNVDAFVGFSKTHLDMLVEENPEIDRAKCHAIGLGVDKVSPFGQLDFEYGNLLWASDPTRGLWHMLDIFAHLEKKVPEATLTIAYDFEGKFEGRKWDANCISEALWGCKERIDASHRIRTVGGLPHDAMVKLQRQCHVFAYPCDPLTPGSELFCLAAMEAAMARRPLVLSATEALPEVFKDHAEFLPIPGTYVPEGERRYDAQDWAEVVEWLMKDSKLWAKSSQEARALAEKHTWPVVVKEWDKLLRRLAA